MKRSERDRDNTLSPEDFGALPMQRHRVEEHSAQTALAPEAPTTVATAPSSAGHSRMSVTQGMSTDFHAKLGPSVDPDEAKDIEATIKGFTDYSDLPDARKAELKSIVKRIVSKIKDHRDTKAAENAYRRWSSPASGGFARKSELIGAYRDLRRSGDLNAVPALEEVLIKKKGKSHSGVLVITVLMGPSKFSCPKDCHYCPNQPGIARSYLLKEPGVLRGFRNHWDPVLQFVDRASALENNGHVVDKIEILILGGTFSFYPKDYCEEFIAGLFFAANTYDDEVTPTKPRRAMASLQDEIRMNETTACRIIGLTIETRPDYITNAELRRFRELGVTRVQIGIQHLDDDVLTVVNRECPTSKTIVAIQRLLDAGFKVDGHWMPDLPGSSFEKDMDMFRFLLSPENQSFQIDQWKVYPTMTVPYTKIKEWYDQGLYKPYAEEQNGDLMVKLIIYIMQHCPYRIRLNRVVRDIPNSYISGGEKRVNLRQVLEAEMSRQGIICKDIRERECKGTPLSRSEAALFIDEFRASHGTEYYISIESMDRRSLFGHLRLRLRDDPSDGIFPVLKGAALIRELHTYGKLVAHDAVNTGAESQHVGVGSQLMQTAENIARQKGYVKCAVISGVGVRGYYAKLGYTLEDTYMVKRFPAETVWQKLRSIFAPTSSWL
jgi:elongator complex protein 3